MARARHARATTAPVRPARRNQPGPGLFGFVAGVISAAWMTLLSLRPKSRAAPAEPRVQRPRRVEEAPRSKTRRRRGSAGAGKRVR